LVQRKKPVGQEYESFCTAWDSANHDQKVKIAGDYGITYDTAKHWRSEGSTDRVAVAEAVPSEDRKIEITEAIGEVLSTRPISKLDFVCFDLETTNLKADFSVILCAAIKPYGGDTIIWRADDYPAWQKGDRADDSEIVADIAKELSKHAVVISHYGTGFDIPYLRAKMIHYGLPPLPPMFHFDTYGVAKRNILVSRRRLDALAEYFNLGSKSPVEGSLWLAAGMNGSKEAMDKIVKHNIVDVELLERLAGITLPYMKSMKKL